MADFEQVDMRGSTFRDVSLTGSRLEEVDLSEVFVRNADLGGFTARGALLRGVELDGLIEGALLVNGVDVAPLVEAELDRRYPDRPLIRDQSTPEAFRTAWAAIEARWEETIGRARTLPPQTLHVRVREEWSFSETLRHLLFVVDAWLKRAVLHDPAPYDPWLMTFAEMGEVAGVPEPPDVAPSLDELWSRLAERMTLVSETFAALTPDQLGGSTTVTGDGYPMAGEYPMVRCLSAVTLEFWEHRLIAERDLTALSGSTQH
ncbi:DinB family protein [Nocardioides insulae]|uniref:DinB family protein n=1 Tax=Nocardioides insulae TaxID=394734 RepID=UPI00040F0B2A|nr:DinB family protein [Nocardioides insulae]